MPIQYAPVFILAALCLFARVVAPAVDLSTDDGLLLRFDSDTGSVARVAIRGDDLPVVHGIRGGLVYRELVPVTTTDTLLARDFDTATIEWNSAFNSDWSAAATCYSLHANGGLSDSGFLRLGDGSRTGTGVAFPQPIPVSPMNRIAIRWQGRVSDTASQAILCVRVFNASGADITAGVPSPPMWGYSATSLAHYIAGIANPTAGVWEPHQFYYVVPDGATSMTVSLRYWRDGDPFIDIDDFAVARAGGLSLGPVLSAAGPLTETTPGTFEQVAVPDGTNLRFTTRYQVFAHHIRGDVTMEDLSDPMSDRLIRADYVVPVDPAGWTWGDDLLRERAIQGGGDFENTFSILERRVSLYPWGCLFDSSHGLALAAPMDVPRLQTFRCSLSRGLTSSVDLALSSRTAAIGAGDATFSFVLYGFEPEWGFRSAAEKYYGIFPLFFERRAGREGCWQYPNPPTVIPNPLDFGFSFFETSSVEPDVIDTCRELNIGVFRYMEPWGAWQNYGSITEKPSYEERMATLDNWAATTNTTARWLRAPRYETARAVLDSAYRDSAGKTYADANSYFWHQWGSSANQLWMCFPDPDLTPGSLSALYKTWYIEYQTDRRDGMYVDSVQASGALADLQDFAPEHFAHVRSPLTFSLTAGTPVIAAQLAQYDYLEWLYAYEHQRGRTVMGNLFPTGYRFYAHLFDVVGSEVFEVRESDAYAALRRTLSYQKVNSNLLQWWKGDQFVTHEQMADYIKNQMFWGIYPGVASCGGGIGWGETIERYFLHPEIYERDRALFKTYIPVIRALSTSGWEPIPYARAESGDVKIERFGHAGDGETVRFTLRNDEPATVTAGIVLQTKALGYSDGELPALRCEDAVDGSPLDVVANPVNREVRIEVTISPGDVRVIAVIRPGAGVGGWRGFGVY